MKKLAIGNYAVARGAYEAGVSVASAYPGTPSTEITEFIAKYSEVNAEWSPNEKVALEVAIGAAVAGARALCSMKHVGLNVAADPLFTVSYTGVNGGLVIMVADDPGMHSSQNEQDSRYYALSSKLPMLEPADSDEALRFTKAAFEMSEAYDTPVLVRMTTRVAHSQSFITESLRENYRVKEYKKDAAKYVMSPNNARARRISVENRMHKLSTDCNTSYLNSVELISKDFGVVCSGAVYQYVKEALPDYSVYKIGMVNPLPIDAIFAFSKKVKKLYVIEELDGFIEMQLKAADIKTEGKNLIPNIGELSVSIIRKSLFGEITPKACETINRPAMLCAGCPHRGVFHIIQKLKLTVMGDIGCYTLGAAPPLSAVDTVVCMGASIGMAVGAEKAQGREFAKHTLAVIGDSTFVHSGVTGMINAVYNNLNTKILILDNSTTGMTGHQPHPGTGRTIKGETTHQLDFEQLAKSCGVPNVVSVAATDITAVEKMLKEQLQKDGVSVMIAKEPCALLKREKRSVYAVNSAACKNCKACIKIGCPAVLSHSKAPAIAADMCAGCGLCAQVCKFGAITVQEAKQQ